MRQLLLVLALLLSLTPIASAAGAVDEAALAKSFGEVFAPDFDLVSHRTALFDPRVADSGTWLLFEVRPKRDGNFALCCDVQSSHTKNPVQPRSRRQEYDLVIAKAGATRFFSQEHGVSVAHPPARVGDTVFIAFTIPANAKEVRFSRDPADPRIAEGWFKYEQEAAQEPKSDADFPIDNHAAAHLSVEGKTFYSAMSESGSFNSNTSGVMLEARSPGQFNLVMSRKDDPKREISIPVVIVPKDQALPVLARRCARDERTGKGESSSSDELTVQTLVLRVGERVSMTCDGWITHRGDPPDAAKPRAVRLTERPLVVQPGTFGFVGLPGQVLMASSDRAGGGSQNR